MLFNIEFGYSNSLGLKRKHLLKRDDLSAHLEVNKCLNISPLFQTSFALLFGHYIEWISKIADCKKILYRCHTFLMKLCRMLSKWHPRCAARSSHFQWVQLLCLCLSALFKLLLRCCHCCCGKRLENLSICQIVWVLMLEEVAFLLDSLDSQLTSSLVALFDWKYFQSCFTQFNKFYLWKVPKNYLNCRFH